MDGYNTYDTVERDCLTGFFLPENYIARKKFSREELDAIIKKILGTDEIEKLTSTNCGENPAEQHEKYLSLKEGDYIQIYFRYSKIFELCRVLGAANLYDIGCQTINQSFLLVNYTTVSYTGINSGGFDLNDFRASDWEDRNYNIARTNNVPPPLCGGRIKFVHGYYPDVKLDIMPNNIAIACYSLTMLRDEESISNMADALIRDYDRILFNVRFREKDMVEPWKKAILKNYELFPIGSQGFLFATKNSEDIKRMKETYPFENGRFITGIDDIFNYSLCRTIPINYSFYADLS